VSRTPAILRYTPSQNDVVVFTALGKAPAGKFAHALRWYNHIKSFGDEKKKFAAAKKALSGGAPAPASKAAADDDDVDLFASEEEVCIVNFLFRPMIFTSNIKYFLFCCIII